MGPGEDEGVPTRPGPVSLAVPALVAAAVAWAMAEREHVARAAVLVLVVAVLTVARALSGGRVDRAISRGAGVVARAIGAVLLVLVFVLVFIPVWLIRTALSPVGRRRRAADATVGWHGAEAEAAGSGEWTFITTRPLGRLGWPGALLGGAVTLVGWVVIVVAIDLVIGSVWLDHVHHGTGAVPMALGTTPDRQVVDLRHSPPSHDPDIGAAAMADSPWRAEYFRELDGGQGRYLPYQLYEPVDAVGEFINISDGVRRSYRPRIGAGQRVPEVAFYGGSTMFGQGSRDLHTIPSEVARLAEADGLPLIAVNRAQRSWTSWQEFHAFEQRSAGGDRPDLAVFYDGVNEVATQPWRYGDQPTEYGASAVAGDFAASQSASGAGAWRILLAQSVDEWRARSIGARAVTRAWQQVHPDGSPGRSAGERPSGRGAAQVVADVYLRAQALSRLVGEQHHIPTRFFWQPQRYRAGTYEAATRLVRPHVVDLSATLDGHPEVYLPDGAHTNEVGSRLAAEAMWRSLRPTIRAWYRDHGR